MWTRSLMLACATLWLGGCAVTLSPLYDEEEQLAFEPELLGTWHKVQEDQTIVLEVRERERDDEDEHTAGTVRGDYHVRLSVQRHDEDEPDQEATDAVVALLPTDEPGVYLVNASSTRRPQMQGQDVFYTTTHVPAIIELDDTSLQLSLLHPQHVGELRERLDADDVSPNVHVVTDRPQPRHTVLVGPPAELRAFMLAGRAAGDPFLLHIAFQKLDDD